MTTCGNCGVELLTQYCLAPACQTYTRAIRILREQQSADEFYRLKQVQNYWRHRQLARGGEYQ